jgi:Ran GTPase-activating protein (RanGAP) involved in mRNA processing and transport
LFLKTHLQANVAPFIPGWHYILERLHSNDAALRTASLAGLGVDDSGATSLSSALLGNRHLKHLHLSQNQIGADGVQQLAALLPRNPLASLHLDCNRIGPHGAGALAHALAQDSACLMHLSLDFTGISDSGATQLAQCLEHNRHLSSLSLVGNELADSGAFALAHALVANEALTHLQLDSNCIADAGATRMIEALERKTSLRVLSLDGNPIGVCISLSLSISLCVWHLHMQVAHHTNNAHGAQDRQTAFLNPLPTLITRDARATPSYPTLARTHQGARA